MVEPSDDSTPREQAGGQEQPGLDDEVDRLLDDVESLTDDLLNDTPHTPAVAPQRDPAAETAPDDLDLAGQSPLIQDGERVGIDEVVADVELTMEKAQRDVRSLEPPVSQASDDGNPVPNSAMAPLDDPENSTGSTPPPEGDAKSRGPASDVPDIPTRPAVEAIEGQVDEDVDAVLDELERMVAESAEQTTPQPAAAADPPDSASGDDADILTQMAALKDDADSLSQEIITHAEAAEPLPEAPTAAASAGPESPAAAPNRASDQVEVELDRLENLLENLEQTTEDRDPASTDDAAAEISETLPDAGDAGPDSLYELSKVEKQLDADLDALLNPGSEPAAVEAQPQQAAVPQEGVVAASAQTVPEDQPSSPSDSAEGSAERTTSPEASALSVQDLASISVWGLLKMRARARLVRLNELAGPWLENRLVAFLDIFDRPFTRLSPKAKELLGYCALGTLAMSAVAVLAALVL